MAMDDEQDRESVDSFETAVGILEVERDQNCLQSCWRAMTCGTCFGSNLVWITLCAAISVIFILVIYVTEVKMANRNVPYLYLIVLMLISVVGQIYCLAYRGCNEFAVERNVSKSDVYVMAGLYLFGIGTLFSIILELSLYIHSSFLLYDCYSKDDLLSKVPGNIIIGSSPSVSNSSFQPTYIYGGYCYTVVVYSSFRLLFVLVQMAFIHSFRHAAFIFSSKVRFVLYQTLLTNLCVWIKYVFDETELFGQKKPVIPGADSFILSAENIKVTLNPFVLEFSLIVAGILSNLSSDMRQQPNICQQDANQQDANQQDGPEDPDAVAGQGNNGNNHFEGRCLVVQPGLLVGSLLGLLLIAFGIMFGNKDNKMSEISKEFFLISELVLAILQAMVVLLILRFIFEHERVLEVEKLSDDVLLAAGFLGTLAFNFVVFYGVSESISKHSNVTFINSNQTNPFQKIDDSITVVQMSFLLLSQFIQMVGIIAFFRRYGPRAEKTSSRWIRQLTLFLLTTNLCFWALDSFIEIKDHVSTSYYSSSENFKGWDTVVALSFPFCVFFRFHSASLLFEFWQNFKFDQHR